MNDQRPIKVLFTSAEAEPFYKVGGLGDYAGSLPIALKNFFSGLNLDLDIRVVLPLHEKKSIKQFNLEQSFSLVIQGKGQTNECKVFEKNIDGITHYFIRQVQPALASEAIYGEDQYLTAYKFALFSVTVLQMIKKLDWVPDIIHTNDWHTALINHLVRSKRTEPVQKPATILTIHNMPFMGYGSEPVLSEFGVVPCAEDAFPAWAQNLPLPMGIAAADQIVAVSPSYADELKTSYFAYGLENYFLAHPEKLTGIINGIDYDRWDPRTDTDITCQFSEENLNARIENKKALFDEIGFEFDLDSPLLVVISRLESQKGIDLILDALSETADLNWKAVILGSGHHGYEYAFRALERILPNKLHAMMEYNPLLAKKLYASGDMILMPSLYEPCGLSQMIAMRYGCIPIAHAVGGLKDSITTMPEINRTGFLFKPATKTSFIRCLKKSIKTFNDQKKWRRIQINAMQKDFSWRQSAASYAEIYKSLARLVLK
jgi:starch synthase